jgi:hypothetical protein
LLITSEEKGRELKLLNETILLDAISLLKYVFKSHEPPSDL